VIRISNWFKRPSSAKFEDVTCMVSRDNLTGIVRVRFHDEEGRAVRIELDRASAERIGRSLVNMGTSPIPEKDKLL